MYPTHATIDLSAIRYNFQQISSWQPGTTPVPIVKSDAYGHGAIPVSKALIEAGATRLAVFRIEEAIRLRDAGITVPIWVLLGALPNEIDDALGKNLTLACWSLDIARAINQKAAERSICQNIHLKIDTGMGRLGFLPSELPSVVEALSSMKALKLTGAFTHIAKADDPDHPVTIRQPRDFTEALTLLPASCTECHLSATPALIRKMLPALPFSRPGIGIYGISPEKDKSLALKPAMTLASSIVSLKRLPKGHTISYDCNVTLQRDSLIAVVPIGYASGFPRALSGNASGLVRGHRVHNLGNICMDMTMFDLTDIPDAAVNDEIILMGKQGEQEITPWELATAAHTIPYELLCGIGATEPREYIN